MEVKVANDEQKWVRLMEAVKADNDKSLGEAVFNALKEAMSEGILQPGDRLREDELANRLNVSRTPIREALSRLVERKLVEPAGGRGLIIRRLSHLEAVDLYAIREIMEGAAARLAAQNATKAEIDLLYSLNEAFSEAGLTSAEYAKRNKRFHHAIGEAAHNQYLNNHLRYLQESLILLGSTTFQVADRARSASDEHKKIVDAIAAKNPEEAEKTARFHIRAAFSVRLKLLNS